MKTHCQLLDCARDELRHFRISEKCNQLLPSRALMRPVGMLADTDAFSVKFPSQMQGRREAFQALLAPASGKVSDLLAVSLCPSKCQRPWHPGAFTFKYVSNQQHTSKTCPPLPLPPWQCYLLSAVLWPGESYLSSLGLSFLICKMAILIVFSLSYSYYEENLKYISRMSGT